MTEPEWLGCTDPILMLEFLRGKATNRKLRLVACAVCRSIWDLLIDKRSREAIEVAERFADGKCREENVASSVDAACDAAHEVSMSEHNVKEAASRAADAAVWCASIYYSGAVEYAITNVEVAARMTAAGSRTGLVRDIIFNPFHAVTLDPAWLTSKVKTLAQAIYDDRAFNAMPILGDALEEAGCTNPDILNHCRRPGPHVRGCWVVDLLLGKE
jgi:hypothetical protein